MDFSDASIQSELIDDVLDAGDPVIVQKVVEEGDELALLLEADAGLETLDHHVVVPGAEAVVDVQALVLADTDDGVLFNLVLAGVGDGVGGD